jgi:transketolase
MREAFAHATTEALDSDASVALVLADISTGYFTDAAARHPDRVVNVGIREQLAVNVGAGMALTGMRPIVHTFAPFLVERAFEQVKLGFGHQDVGGVLVSVGASYDNSLSGRTHQAPGDVAMLDTLPGWQIHVPGHPDELARMLAEAVAGGGRVYIRASSGSNASPMPSGTTVVRRGRRGSVLVIGPLLDNALAATEGLDVTVLYTPTARPLDAAPVVETLGAPHVVVVEPYAAGTSVGAVSAALQHLPHRVLGLGVPRVELRRYGTPRQHEAAHGLDAAGLRGSIASFLG